MVGSTHGDLRVTHDVDAYFAAPGGACLLRRGFVCASPGGDLFGLLAWGKLELTDTEALFEVFAATARHPLPPRQQLVLLDAVDSISMAAMAAFMQYFMRPSHYLRTIAREAVVRPRGVAGMLAEGFYPLVKTPYPGKITADLGEALAFLGRDSASLGPWLAKVRACAQNHRDGATLETVTGLAALLATHGARLGLASAAAYLGQSERSLQRRLAAAGTSFERERTRICTERARTLLLETERSVKDIADELGFSSPARFVETFGRATGLSPGAFRSRHASPSS